MKRSMAKKQKAYISMPHLVRTCAVVFDPAAIENSVPAWMHAKKTFDAYELLLRDLDEDKAAFCRWLAETCLARADAILAELAKATRFNTLSKRAAA